MSGVEKMENIIIKGARVNNLKNIDVNILENSFTCITGVSGCGKSSLVYNTIYAESQRNFLESMSGNMFGQKLMDKPDVDEIINLHPALDISQNYYNNNPRSTIGTLTDISFYLRSLFALLKSREEGIKYKEGDFSSNNPESCCNFCGGLGYEYAISEKLVIPDETKILKDGAILFYKGKENSLEYRLLEAICDKYDIDLDKSFVELNSKQKDILLYRNNNEEFNVKYKTPKGRYKQQLIVSNGVMVELTNQLENINTPSVYASLSKYLVKNKCSVCDGSKLNKKVLDKYICDKNIADVEELQFLDLVKWLKIVEEKYKKDCDNKVILEIIHKVYMRVNEMINLKLGYLSTSRNVTTLSSGEIQRIRVSVQLICPLRGLIYILDEPCKGLHPRNVQCIISATKELVNKGNTVLAIEHDVNYILAADKVIELGPVGGPKGGFIINFDKKIKPPTYKESNSSSFSPKNWISFKNINFHNLKNCNVEIPVEHIITISGVSGAGKSSLITIIGECIANKSAICCESVTGMSEIKKVVHVNQKPIGKTPRSTVVSYLGIYDLIREIYAKQSILENTNITATSFSMNVQGGRCERCQGTGLEKIEMNYLPDSYITCSECMGQRFTEKVLSVKYKGYTISDLLDNPIENIKDVFINEKDIYIMLQCLIDIGLGYITLGQKSMNLSGGEAQRIKLAKAFGQRKLSKVIYILDEPSSGLSQVDCVKLTNIIMELKKKGNTIIIVDHNKKFIFETSDYVIDMGVESGNQGGKICATGRPEEVFANNASSWFGF